MRLLEKVTCKGSEIRDIDVTRRLVSGNALYYNETHDDGEGPCKVAENAFNASVSMYGPSNHEFIKTYYNHSQVIGKPLELTNKNGALWTVNYIGKSLYAGDILMLIEDGIIDSMSVGYWVDKKHHDFEKSETVITKASLFDISIVSWPVNPKTKGIQFGAKVIKAYRDGKYKHPSTWAELEQLADHFEGIKKMHEANLREQQKFNQLMGHIKK